MNMPVWAKPAIVGMCVGAVAVAIVGFSWGGWVTTKKANIMAANEAHDQLVAALTPICLDNSAADPNMAATLAKLKEAGSYQRPNIVMEAGWATMPGATEPDRVIALACVRQLAIKF